MLVKIGQRGTVTIPKEIREGLNDETLLDIIRRSDGVIELRPQTMIDSSQAWFWSERWQKMEREADEDIRAGRVKTFDNADAFLAWLDSPAEPGGFAGEIRPRRAGHFRVDLVV